MIFVYAISSLVKNYIYVGQTDHVIRRFHEHNDGLEKTTKPFAPFELIYSEEFQSKSEALKREKFFKSGHGRSFLKKIGR